MKCYKYFFLSEASVLRVRKLLRFVFVGAAGFLIDGGLLEMLMQLDWKILPARAVSFSVAVTCTWVLNRFWTFQLSGPNKVQKEYAMYIVMQIIGAAINLAVFFIVIEIFPFLRIKPLIPLAIGASISLMFNYTLSKRYVFKG